MEAQQPQFHAIHLHVTEGAQTEMFGELPLLYVGISYHISRDKLEEAQQVFESTQDALQAQRVIMNVDISPDSAGAAGDRSRGFPRCRKRCWSVSIP